MTLNTHSQNDSVPTPLHRVAGKKGHVSARGASNLALPMAYLSDHFTCIADFCDPITNPQGHIPLAVAENRLVIDLLQARLATLETAKAGFDHPEVYGYNNSLGLQVVRETLAQFMQEHFCSSSNNNGVTIQAQHIAVGAGVISFLSNLCFALGSPGDAVLVPAPYYAAFDNDLRAHAGCQTIPVVCENPVAGPTVQELEQAKIQAEQAGWNVRFLLLTNPNNPLGVVYKPTVLKDAIGWARSHSMDTIVDEIYALSVFDKDEEFVSVIQLLDNQLGDDVHVLWGLSKDFGASGFRFGVLYSQNELLLEAIGNLNVFAGVSHPVQRMMADMIRDKPFAESFLEEARQRLKRNYTICARVLEEVEVPFVTATAGMFLYLDLSEWIQTPQEEAVVSQILMKRARMVLTPGTSQHDPQPGKFRICYAYVSPEVLAIGMERFRKVVSKIREQGGLGEWIDEDSHWQGIIV